MAGMIAATGSMGAAAAENISEAGAEEIALKDAGVGAAEITFDRVERGTEQGVSVYEIEFSTADKEYDYDISIADGEIVNGFSVTVENGQASITLPPMSAAVIFFR